MLGCAISYNTLFWLDNCWWIYVCLKLWFHKRKLMLKKIKDIISSNSKSLCKCSWLPSSNIKEIYQRTRALLALSFHFKLFGKNLIFKVKKIGKYQLLTLHDVKLLNSSEVNSRGININTWPIFLIISLFNISLVNTCVI